MSKAMTVAFRAQKDDLFKSGSDSPLTPEQKQLFEGLNYFDYMPDLNLRIEVPRIEDDDVAQVMTTKNEIRNYRRYGRFSFAVTGETATLTIYDTGHGYFLPFVDASEETYPAGRYLDLEAPVDGVFHIDFNRAYNPFCAYNDRWNCPITPAENRLTVAIPAGEKLFTLPG